MTAILRDTDSPRRCHVRPEAVSNVVTGQGAPGLEEARPPEQERVWFCHLCEKNAHLSVLKEWSQRHVKYSRSQTLMADLQNGVCSKPGTLRVAEVAFYC